MAPNPKPAPPPSPAPTSDDATPHPVFPLASLGPVLEAAAGAVAARTQAPAELAAHHILTLAAITAQRLVSLRLPTGQRRPASCFFVTLAGACERADAAEKLVVGEVRQWEIGFEEEFPVRFRAYIDDKANAGAPRERPLERVDLFWDRKGNVHADRYGRYRRQAGLFARHPFDVVQPGAHERAEADSLCALWDGIVHKSPFDAPFFPRLSLHLVASPRDGRGFLGRSRLYDSGLLARVLAVEPASRVGERAWTPREDDRPPPELGKLMSVLCELYARHPTAETRVLGFTKGAAALWFAFAAEVEKGMARGGPFATIRAFADRLPEHAARLTAVIGLMNDCALDEIGVADLERGIAFARFYAAENLRLCELSPPALSEDEQAELLKDWLARRDGKDISLRDICRSGPPAVRQVETAFKIMRSLESSGFVTPKSATSLRAATPRRVSAPYLWQVGEVSRDVA